MSQSLAPAAEFIFVKERWTALVSELMAYSSVRGSPAFASCGRSLPDRGFVHPQLLNTGVFFARPSEWAASFVHTWAAERNRTCRAYRRLAYVEQGCLEVLLTHKRTLLPGGLEDRVYLAPMDMFNSPWGSLISHLWGRAGKMSSERRHSTTHF